MTTTAATPRSGSLPRSVGAVLLGLISIFVLSLGTDQVLHVLKVYPPWGEPMRSPGLNLLALAYRVLYAGLGCYLTARFAPHWNGVASTTQEAVPATVVGYAVAKEGIAQRGTNARLRQASQGGFRRAARGARRRIACWIPRWYGSRRSNGWRWGTPPSAM